MTTTTTSRTRLDRQEAETLLVRPFALLRLEGLALLGASVAAHLSFGGHPAALLLGFLADLTFVGYLAGPRIGAALYNLAHSTVVPLALVAAGLLLRQPTALFAGLILLSHIGFDRALGYGLKYPDAFKHTHLTREG